LLYDIQMFTKCFDCTPLGEVSEWADDVRAIGARDVSHAIGTKCHREEEGVSVYTAEEDAYGDNVVGNIVSYSWDLHENLQQRRQLGISAFLDDTFVDQQKESLMFLVHLMGDLHQPLHCGCSEDRAGLKIWVDFLDYYNKESHPFPFICVILPDFLASFLGCDLNLHMVWDNSFVTKTLEDFDGSRRAFESDLWYELIEGNEEQKAEWLSCFPDDETVPITEQQLQQCVSAWASESLQLALEYAYPNVDGSAIVSGDYLDEDYYRKALPVLRTQLAAGGVRLAAILERVLI